MKVSVNHNYIMQKCGLCFIILIDFKRSPSNLVACHKAINKPVTCCLTFKFKVGKNILTITSEFKSCYK